MPYLALVSLIWAFSFGLIGSTLRGVDSNFVALVRLSLALLLLLPFFRWKRIAKRDFAYLMFIGSIQFGVMYVAYIQAFKFIPSHLVALFSILTPVYVVLIHDIRQFRFNLKYLFVALLSVSGAAVIRFEGHTDGLVWIGFGLMQVAGVAFAFGQVAYRDWKQENPDLPDQEAFALLYMGGCLFTGATSVLLTNWDSIGITIEQGRALVYLGLIASGAGFFLWNKGAAQTNAGTLAAFNNAVVPLGVLCSLFVFGEIDQMERGQFIRLVGGAALIGTAVALSQTKRANTE